MLLTLAAAGTTLLVGAILLGGPAVSACMGDSRGLVQCLRGMVDDRFELGVEPETAVAPLPAVPAADEPVADAPPVGQLADAPMVTPATPPVTETPATPEIIEPDVPEPVEPDLPTASTAEEPVSEPEVAPETAPQKADEPSDNAPPEKLALAKVDEPAAEAEPPPQAEARSFVPPPPAIEIDGVPPDLTAAEPAPPAPGFVLPSTPALPTSPPPDLRVAAVVPDVAIELPPAPDLPTSPSPDLQAPPAPAEPAPDFALPEGPEVPAEPPPDLRVAAVDPHVPPAEAPPAVPVLAPTIDAVEIEGDGNFIAGSGPAGATMRLYVDGLPVGVSPVEGGRWLVEGSDLLTEERQTLKVEALDPVTGKVLGEATVTFERPVEPVANTPAAETVVPTVEPAPAAEPAPPVEPAPSAEPALPIEPVPQAEPAPSVESVPSVIEEQEAASEPPPPAEAEPPAIPPIAPVVPSGEGPSVTILEPAPEGEAFTALPTGEPSGEAVVNLGTPPTSPAIIAEFTLREPEAAPDVTVLRAVPIGDPGAGRFVSGKAIIRRGDTLWDIAHRFYGRGVHYRTIVRANRDLIARPGKIYPGQVFELPLVYDD